MKLPIKKRDLAMLLAGMAIAGLLITPAGAHVTTSVTHLWTKHIKPQVTKLVYTKTQSNAKYLGKTAKAADADKLDGKDASEFAPLAEAWHEVGAAGEPAFNNGDFTQIGADPSEYADHETCWWSNYDGNHQSAAFYKDPFGNVHLKGLVQAHDGDAPSPVTGNLNCGAWGGEPRWDNFVFDLPAGYRPAKRVVLTTMGNAKPMRVNIDPDGAVSLGAESEFTTALTFDDVQQWLSLDGLSFRTT
jgi:hypothetical protein